jgi:hypothetical protein
MSMLKPVPFEQDFKNTRLVRQNNNNKTVYNSLMSNDIELFNENINEKEFKRTLSDLNLTKEQFILKCREDVLFAKISARLISKNASRQGSKDEDEQLRTCNLIAKKCGLTINNLTSTELRPTKDGYIVSKNEMKNNKISKDCCLKSFDGKISGKVNGFITAKVSYGYGGHQDNVFEEMDTIAEWWKKYKYESKDILIILIDTDLTKKFKTLIQKYNDVKNVMVFNHIEFQQYMIDTYYIDDSK